MGVFVGRLGCGKQVVLDVSSEARMCQTNMSALPGNIASIRPLGLCWLWRPFVAEVGLAPAINT